MSLPSFELFDEQPAEVSRRSAAARASRPAWPSRPASANAGTSTSARSGAFVGLDTFGASAPYQEIYKHRGLTAAAVVAKAKELAQTLTVMLHSFCLSISERRAIMALVRRLTTLSGRCLVCRHFAHRISLLVRWSCCSRCYAPFAPRACWSKCRAMRWGWPSCAICRRPTSRPPSCSALSALRCLDRWRCSSRSPESTPGLDHERDLLLVLLPPEHNSRQFHLAVWLPVNDYDALVRSLEGDPERRIAAVTIAGEDLLVVRHGDWAVVMDPDQRDRLEQLRDAAAVPASSPPRQIAEWTSWIDSNDAAVVVLPAGMRTLWTWAASEPAIDRECKESRGQ